MQIIQSRRLFPGRPVRGRCHGVLGARGRSPTRGRRRRPRSDWQDSRHLFAPQYVVESFCARKASPTSATWAGASRRDARGELDFNMTFAAPWSSRSMPASRDRPGGLHVAASSCLRTSRIRSVAT